MRIMRYKWKHAIREAHRIWAHRLILGGAFMRYRTRFVHWDDLRIVAVWNRRRA